MQISEVSRGITKVTYEFGHTWFLSNNYLQWQCPSSKADENPNGLPHKIFFFLHSTSLGHLFGIHRDDGSCVEEPRLTLYIP